jgi:hypothetical protein
MWSGREQEVKGLFMESAGAMEKQRKGEERRPWKE